MKPCVWSKKKYEKEGTGWHRACYDISYSSNQITRDLDNGVQLKKMHGDQANNNAWLFNMNGAGEGVEHYYTLSFYYDFEPNQNDELWFAHAVPYTFTKM